MTSLVQASGNQDIDGILWGWKLDETNITYSFPTGTAEYEGYAAINGFEAFNADQQTAVVNALNQIASFTQLTFTPGGQFARLRFAEADSINYTDNAALAGHTGLHTIGTAEANPPELGYNGAAPYSPEFAQGDGWFNHTTYNTPGSGSFAFACGIMHETGHNLGLKHGHTTQSGHGTAFPLLPNDHNSFEYSIMTYNSFVGDTVATINAVDCPTTYMQDDLMALQYMYGANYNFNSGATTYSWSSTTGQMSINGVGQTAPVSNFILMTVWDGGGIDTYDFANYATNLTVNLAPGAWTSTGVFDQVANLGQDTSNITHYARGNVANAMLYRGSGASLIENANGGAGSDALIGNQAANLLRGNGGADVLTGDIGADTLYGGDQNDLLFGDARTLGDGHVTKGVNAGNNSFALAMDVTSKLSLAADADIQSATTQPHVTIAATSNGAIDFYKLTVAAGATLTFDIDHTSSNLDSFIKLYGPNGAVLTYDDDSALSDGAGGSASTHDSFLTYLATEAGTYVIEVGAFSTSTTDGPMASGATYELQISANGSLGNGDGADILDGGTGADTMGGGLGNDLYYVDDAKDVIVEAAVGGTDTIATKVSYLLATGLAVETLRTTSTLGTASLSLAGNDLAQTILGNAGNNTIYGRGGADILTGLGGADTFVFDRAIGPTNVDHITDFAHASDKISLDHDIFTLLPIGALAATAFKDLASAPEDADDRILYSHANGAMFYDMDGVGGAAAKQFAVLNNHVVISATDFVVVA